MPKREPGKFSQRFVDRQNRSVYAVPTPRTWTPEQFAVAENRRLNPTNDPAVARQIGMMKHPAGRTALGGRNPRPIIKTL
jgi:hypothetical protein